MFSHKDVEAYIDEILGEHAAPSVTATEFLAAAVSGNAELVKRYIQQHSQGYHWLQRCNAVNVSDNTGNTALLLAARNNHPDIVSLLLAMQLDVNARNDLGDTALTVASAAGHVDVVRLLLSDHRVETGPVNVAGDTPLTVAIRQAHVEVVKEILETGTLTSQFAEHLRFLQEDPSDSYQQIRELIRFHKERFDFRASLNNYQEMAREDIRLIHTMTARNFSRVMEAAVKLKVADKYNVSTLSAAIHRITASIPVAEESTRSKIKDTNKKITLDGAVSFYMQPKRPASFMDVLNKFDRNTVKIGYEDSTCQQPKYGVKKLRDFTFQEDDAGITETKGESGALREVKYQRLLGRDAFWFKNHDKAATVIYPWQEGRNLDHFTPEEMKVIPFVRRLQWLTLVLDQLNMLHQHYRVYGDIKVENIVLSMDQDRMSLVDFESTHKIHSGKVLPHMYDESEGSYQGPNKPAEDMYGLSFPLQALFPELLFISRNSRLARIKQHITSGLTVMEQAVIHLFQALTEKKQPDRCTSEQALAYCQAVIAKEKLGHLDGAALDNILAKTLNRTTVSVEDALRESLRPMKFSS